MLISRVEHSKRCRERNFTHFFVLQVFGRHAAMIINTNINKWNIGESITLEIYFGCFRIPSSQSQLGVLRFFFYYPWTAAKRKLTHISRRETGSSWRVVLVYVYMSRHSRREVLSDCNINLLLYMTECLVVIFFLFLALTTQQMATVAAAQQQR